MMMCCSWLLVPFLLLSGMATEIFGSRPGQCKTERAMTTQVQCSIDEDCSAPKKCCPTRGGGARCEIPATNCHQLNCSRCKIDTITGFALCVVNGNWGSWNYGTCSVTCGGGTQERTRACDNPPPANGGADCVGNNIETQVCNTELCPVDGIWGEWVNYGTCKVTCGQATQERTRACDSPAPANGGADCVGVSTDTQDCSTAECSDNYCSLTGSAGTITSPNYPLNYDNNLGCDWLIRVSPGSTITLTFHDFEIEYDEVNCINVDYFQVQEENGSLDPTLRSCGPSLPSPVSSGFSLSIYFHTNAANTFRGFNATYIITAVDGNWGEWSNFGTCSVSCGGGTQERTRACDNPPKANGGADCVGNDTETQICNTELCSVDGIWGEWGNWGSCSAACGQATQERTRACDSPAPANGGTICEGVSTETRACSTASCSANTCSLTGSAGTITSQNYPLNYNDGQDCDWTIQVGTGSTIVLTFLDFETEVTGDAQCIDYVEVREDNINGRLISKSCGSTLPSPVVSSTTLYIYFHSDGSDVFTGFKATYTITGSAE